jgi:hypothetical protein
MRTEEFHYRTTLKMLTLNIRLVNGSLPLQGS